jgi:prepilin-type N-terminal cleavage/methylation domain-containing protein
MSCRASDLVNGRPRQGLEPSSDRGFTLIEVLIVMIILGVVSGALAFAFSVAIRTNPDNADRIDDSRSTRGLATWLSYDTSSTPPFVGERAQGGMLTTPANDCGGPGTNLLHLKWVEAAPVRTTYVANYRFVSKPSGDGQIVRVACFRRGTTPYQAVTAINVTSNLSPAAIPGVTLVQNDAGLVAKVTFSLTGNTGESVLIETASRNPADFFP